MKQEYLNEVLELYNKGFTSKKIAEILDKHENSISYALKKLGLKNKIAETWASNKIKNKDVQEKIMELYKQGKTQREIAECLNLNRVSLQRYYTRNNLIAKGNQKYLSSELGNFILRLKDKAPTFEYVSGYENDNSKVKLRCKNCGDIIERWASSVRANSNYRCFNCEKLETKRKEQEKKKAREEEKQKRILQRQLDNSIQLSFFVCQHCGNLFVPTGNRTKYCSDRCYKRHSEQRRSRVRIERAKQNGEVDYTITLDKLIKKDNNKCYLCGGDCNLNDFIMQGNQKVTGNYYPSIDHVIPLANGGTHSWNNVRLAHRICNSMKSNKNIF